MPVATVRLRSWLIACLSLLVFLVLLEIGLRLAGLGGEIEQAGVENMVQFDPLVDVVRAAQDPRAVYADIMKEMQQDCPPFTDKKPAGMFRIVCLGASSTFGQGGCQYAYPGQLLQILNQGRTPPRFEVINFGIPGTSLYEQRLFFERFMAETELDLMIVLSGPNFRAYLKRYRDQQKILAARKKNLPLRAFSHLALYRLVFGRQQEARRIDVTDDLSRYPDGRIPDQIYLADYLEDMNTLYQEGRRRGFQLAFVQSIEVDYINSLKAAQVHPDDAKKALALQLDQTVLNFTQQNGLLFVPVYRDFLVMDPNTPGLWQNMTHPGKLGNHLIAVRIAQALRENRLLPPDTLAQ